MVSLKKNFIMNALLTGTRFLFPLIIFPYISRVLFPEGVGRVSFATSLINYFNMFAQMGIPVYGIRICAKVREDKEKLSRCVHELLHISLITSILAYTFLFIAVFTVPRLMADRQLYMIISLTLLLDAIGIEWMYKGLEEYTYISIRSVIFRGIALIAVFIMVKSRSDYIIYGGISIFAASAANILNFVNARKYIYMGYLGHYDYKKHLKSIGVFFAISCATQIYGNLDNVMLGFMKTDTDVGYYDTAVKIKNILTTVVTSLGAVLLPRVSYLVEKRRLKEFLLLIKKALMVVSVFSFPICILCVVFASYGIRIMAGEAYEGAVLPMQLISFCVFFIGITNILGMQVLVPLGKERLVLYSVIGGAVIDFIINLRLIPQMGAAGAAIGTLVAESVVLILQIAFIIRIIVKKEVNFVNDSKNCVN